MLFQTSVAGFSLHYGQEGLFNISIRTKLIIIVIWVPCVVL